MAYLRNQIEFTKDDKALNAVFVDRLFLFSLPRPAYYQEAIELHKASHSLHHDVQDFYSRRELLLCFYPPYREESKSNVKQVERDRTLVPSRTSDFENMFS